MRLARLSGVSRFKICTYELGDGSLTAEEHSRIQLVLQREAEGLRSLATSIQVRQPLATANSQSEAPARGPLDVPGVVLAGDP